MPQNRWYQQGQILCGIETNRKELTKAHTWTSSCQKEIHKQANHLSVIPLDSMIVIHVLPICQTPLSEEDEQAKTPNYPMIGLQAQMN